MDQTILVTGANAGIGFAAAFEIARQSDPATTQLVLAGRDAAKGQAACEAIAAQTSFRNLEWLTVDFARQASMRDAAQGFLRTHSTLEVLVNNAGVAVPKRSESHDGIELTFATNVIGYQVWTHLLLGALKKSGQARIVNVASMMAYGLDPDDLEFRRRRYDGSAAYAQSKQANRMLSWAWARRLTNTGVTVNAMSPGPVQTRLLHTLAPGFSGRTPAQGADTVVWLALSDAVAGKSGRFWADRQERTCSFRDMEAEETLWLRCENLIRKDG